MKAKILTVMLMLCVTSVASAQTGEKKETSGSSTTTGTPQKGNEGINNNNRQTQGSGNIDVNKMPNTPLPEKRPAKKP